MHTFFLNLTNILLVTRFQDLCPSKIFLSCRNTCGLHIVNKSSPDLARHVSHTRNLPSYARHLLFTYTSRDTYFIPKPYPGPPASRVGSHTRRNASVFYPPKFYYQTPRSHYPGTCGRRRKLTDPQSTSSRQRLNYVHSKNIYIYALIKILGYAPLFFGP
jgi:hypothetical protein